MLEASLGASVVVPVEEEQREGRDEQEGEYQQPKVARVARRRVDVVVALDEVLVRLLGDIMQLLDLVRLLVHLAREEVREL